MLFDLHIHTTISPCSKLDIQDILAWSRSLGLDGVCLTDHDTMTARNLVREGLQPDGLCVIIGMEYATPSGDFLIFGPFEKLPPGLPAVELLDIVEKNSGAAVAAHPFRKGRATSEYVFQEGRCRLAERINGRNPELANLQAATLSRRYAVAETGGSDAHSLSELGRVVTRFHSPIRNRADLIAELRAGRCEPAWNFERWHLEMMGFAAKEGG